MENHNTKPDWANECYLEELTKVYNWYSMYKDGNAWKGLTQWKGVTGFNSKEDYLQFIYEIKSMIDKVTSEVSLMER
jgi:hypothetical protein